MDSGDTHTWRERLRGVQALVPTLAVVTVVVAALLATVMVTTSERQAGVREAAVSPVPRANELGAGPACSNCGVVESVAASQRQGLYRLRIRMDDGTVRTVEQRGALTAGARVVLEGSSVRVMPAATRQG